MCALRQRTRRVGASVAGTMPIGSYVGRSCPIVPPLQEVVFPRPSISALESAVPRVDDRSLACLADKLLRSEPVRIVFYGSSVTAGIKCNHKRQRSVNFPQQTVQLIEQIFPLSNMTIDVYGYPGASPSFLRACHSTLMRTDAADLYVIEMTDNLSDGYSSVGQSVEALMSSVQQRAPNAALVLLAPIPQRCVRALKRMKPFQHVPKDDASTLRILREDCYSNNTVAASFEDVGAAHNLTTISARHLIREELFNKPAAATATIGRLHYDAVHPNGAGNWVLAVALEHAITRYARAGSSSQRRSACSVRPAGALESANIFAPRKRTSDAMVCAVGEELRQYVLRASGWTYIVERNAQGLPKPGYIAVEPGSTMDLCYRPELKRASMANAGLHHQVTVAWSLGYLMSYEHMGQMRGECLGHEQGSSCTCGSRVFNAHWRLPVSQPHVSRLKLQIHYGRKDATGLLVPRAAIGADAATAASMCPCIIRLTLLNETSSNGKKFKLVSLMSGFYTGTIVSYAVDWAARYDLM